MTKQEQIQSKLLRMEATALFAQIDAMLGTVTIHSISDYRAYLYRPMNYRGISVDLYLEREAHVGKAGDNLWSLNIEVEGKERQCRVLALLEPLRTEGYDISEGSENLDRQMKFSMGLYGACQQRIFVKPRVTMPVFESVMRLMHYMEEGRTADLPDDETNDDTDFPDVIFGDWQTWK